MISIDTALVSKTPWGMNVSSFFSSSSDKTGKRPGSVPLCGSIYVIEHFLKAGASDQFWAQTCDVDKQADLVKREKEAGFNGHAFWPTVDSHRVAN